MKTNRRRLSNENPCKNNVYCPERCKNIVQWKPKQTASHWHAWDRRAVTTGPARRNASHNFRSNSTIRMMRDECTIDLWIKTRDGWCWIWSAADATRPPALYDKLDSALKPRNKNKKQKKTSVKDVRMLSSEQPNELIRFYFETKFFDTNFIPKFRRAIMVSNIS